MSLLIKAHRVFYSDYPIKGRYVARIREFLALCLVTLVSLLCAPLIGEEQQSDENHSVPLHGRRVMISPFMAQARLAADPPGSIEPVPIAGGILVPPLIHVFAPGPADQGLQGIDVEPNVITNFRGFAALAYPEGTATDSNGNTYDLMTDMRVFQGEYVSVDGTHHRGTFAFI